MRSLVRLLRVVDGMVEVENEVDVELKKNAIFSKEKCRSEKFCKGFPCQGMGFLLWDAERTQVFALRSTR